MDTPSLIKNIRHYTAKVPNQKAAFVLYGFGGSVWQTKRLLRVLHKAGYDITAMDFSKEVLAKGDPALLIRLIDEMIAIAEREARKSGKPILLIGISLGALVSLNILRRSSLFDAGVLITGGDIVKVAQNIYGQKVWPYTYEELAKVWQDVNMYTKPGELQGKRLLFVLPVKDRLIDPTDVRLEVQAQTQAGNELILIERRSFGHIGTIIEETIVFPRRVLAYIQKVQDD